MLYVCGHILNIALMKNNLFSVFMLLATIVIVNQSLLGSNNYVNPQDIDLSAIEMLSSTECNDCNVGGGKGAVSCSCTGGTISIPPISGGGAACDVSVGSGYFACCYKDKHGICRCPSCPNE